MTKYLSNEYALVSNLNLSPLDIRRLRFSEYVFYVEELSNRLREREAEAKRTESEQRLNRKRSTYKNR